MMNNFSFGYKKIILFFILCSLFFLRINAQDSLTLHQLPEVFVSATPKIDTISNKDYSVVDYLFFEDHILLLVYVNVFSKYELLSLNEDFEEKHRLSLTDKRPIKLFKSCIDGVYLITEFYHYRIYLDASEIRLKQAKFGGLSEELVNPCAWSSDNFLYFTKYYFQGQAMKYYAIPHNENHSSHTLPLIENEANIKLLIEETGQRMPRSGDFWQANVSDGLEELRDLDYRLQGMMKIFYPKLYAPIYSIDSILLLFNHSESKLQYYTESGSLFQEIDIHYHQNKKWKKEIFFDRIDQKVYTTFDTRWGETIHQIDLTNGSIGTSFFIERPFIDKKKVRAGFLYFLYHDPYTQSRNKMLHRIKIN